MAKGGAVDEIVWLVTAIIVLTIIAVVFGSSQTAGVINTASSTFSAILKEAVSPVQA